MRTEKASLNHCWNFWKVKKSIVFCHQKIIAIPSFLVAHLYESIYPTPSSSFLILSILHLWFNTFYVVSGWKFRSYIPYHKPLTKGFSAWTLTNVTAFSFKLSFDILSFRDPSFRGNFPWPFMGKEIFWNRFIHCRFKKYCLPSSSTGFPYTSTRMHLFPCVPLRSKVTVEALWGTIKVCVITWSTWFPWKRYKNEIWRNRLRNRLNEQPF